MTDGEYPQNDEVGRGGMFPKRELGFIGEGDVAAYRWPELVHSCQMNRKQCSGCK